MSTAANTTATAVKPKHNADRLAQVLIAPIVSEKATMAAEKHNQVLFKVMRDATKPEIKAAVELMFKVEVESVSTVIQKGKVKRFGKSIGRRDHVKKAYVSLKAGQELNFSGEASGLPLCRCACTTFTTARRPGDVGLTLTTAITQPPRRSSVPGLPSGRHRPS